MSSGITHATLPEEGNELNELYSSDRIMTVLERIRRPGGIPMEEKTKKHVAYWLRSLVSRGYLDGKLLSNGVAAKEAYKTFENATTRGQYARAVIAYIGGLTDDEFATEYPHVTRGDAVKLMKDIIAKGGRETKAQRQANSQAYGPT